MSVIHTIKTLVPIGLWRIIRKHKIIRCHAHVADICEGLVSECETNHISFEFEKIHRFDSEKIIWQYWAQGYSSLPSVVQECLASVDKYCSGYSIVRLDDDNLGDYIKFPEWFEKKRNIMSSAHFSDILRVVLLSTYGGIWMDATIKLTASIPTELSEMPFFVFRRDDNEPNKDYWENTYAYYFGWDKGFKVRMLNSFIVAQRAFQGLRSLKNCLLFWWQRHEALPDFFFFQILFDVMVKRGYNDMDCKVFSDTLPHYMQQSINDPAFSLVASEKIPEICSIHKLTYKKETFV